MSLGRIKGKADELRNRINEFLKDIHGKIILQQQQQQNGIQQSFQQQYLWPELLEQYSVLGDQLSNLASSLTDENGSMLNHFVVIPQVIDPSLPEKIPDLFRTKTLPEMEDSDQEMFNQCPPEKRQKVSDRISKHQRICEDLYSKFEDNCSQLDLSTSFDPLPFEPSHAVLKTLLSAIANGMSVRSIPVKQSIPPQSHSPSIPPSSSIPAPLTSSVPPTITTPMGIPTVPSSVNPQPLNNQLNVHPPNLNPSVPQHIPPSNIHQTPFNIANQPAPNPLNIGGMPQRGQAPVGVSMQAAPKGSANPVKMAQPPGQPGVVRPLPPQVAKANSIYSSLSVAQKQEVLQIHQRVSAGGQVQLTQQQTEHYNCFKIIMAYKHAQQKIMHQQQLQHQQMLQQQQR
eukprot:TRINITY_DN2975_c0_g1_i1.p1 TRINITY_DN2975_c0_g1~~TRINITY_DN2975_c0_g1_i1.p1  ORF type:complete len:399 (+),score=114.05 TRINITY_DN2975_c0_g1_i1:175-1371(+)